MNQNQKTKLSQLKARTKGQPKHWLSARPGKKWIDYADWEARKNLSEPVLWKMNPWGSSPP